MNQPADTQDTIPVPRQTLLGILQELVRRDPVQAEIHRLLSVNPPDPPKEP